MDQLLINPGFPLLSTLIFLPLAGAFVLLPLKSDEVVRYIALAVTALAAVLSLALVVGFHSSNA